MAVLRGGDPCEDLGSVVADPQFGDVAHFDFTVPATSPATGIGFVPCDASQAGRGPNAVTPPAVPAAFPLQISVTTF